MATAEDPLAAATARVGAFIASLEAPVHAPAPGEWGIRLESAGHPLDVGVLIRGGLLRVQAAVLPAGLIDPHLLLYWNRQAPLVAFAENRAGEVFVCGELPLDGLAAETLDRCLGLALASATRAREYVLAAA